MPAMATVRFKVCVCVAGGGKVSKAHGKAFCGAGSAAGAHLDGRSVRLQGRRHLADPGGEHRAGVAAVGQAEGAAGLGPDDRQDGRGQLGEVRLSKG